jgi:uncharacterized membrane protein
MTTRPSPTRSERFVLWFSQHWLAVFNLFVFIYLGLPFAAPALMAAGLEGPGRAIYTAYYPLCHQYGFRSWFLFGPQASYSRAEFEQVTGIDTSTARGLIASKNFLGTPQLGYKVAFCERDVAIYAGLLAGGFLFIPLRTRARPIHWVLWVLIGIVPIALDGFSQLFAELPSFLIMANPLYHASDPYWRESTPFLRALTGGLFGFMLVWLAYPYVEDSMLDTRFQLLRKLGWK